MENEDHPFPSPPPPPNFNDVKMGGLPLARGFMIEFMGRGVIILSFILSKIVDKEPKCGKSELDFSNNSHRPSY